MLLMMSFMMNLLFLNFNNPLIMSIILIIQTLIINLIMGKIYYSFWFSYIMFLIFIGGLFILFIYIISLIYNNKLYLVKKMNYWISVIILCMMLKFYMNSFYMNNETNTNINMVNLMMKENYMNLLKFYNAPNNLINLLMISYLFIMLIITMKITNFISGPIKTLN